jgi:hypothetical protein
MKDIYVISLVVLAFLISKWALNTEPYENQPGSKYFTHPEFKLPARYNMHLDHLDIKPDDRNLL